MDRQAAVRLGAVRSGKVGVGLARHGKVRSSEELATAAKRLAAVVYPMWSGRVSLGAVRRGLVGYGMAHLAGGQLATVGLPVGAVRRGLAAAWQGVVWSGMVW